MRGEEERPVVETASGMSHPAAGLELERRVLAERVRLLYARAHIAQAAVVLNALLVSSVFRGLVPLSRSLPWTAAVCALAALRMWLVRAYQRRLTGRSHARAWARRFAAEAALTGVAWGAGAVLFYAPGSLLHQVFLVFVVGGMTAGAASSNASYTPAFAAFAVPALTPLVIMIGVSDDPVHAAMALMLTVFGAAMGGLSRGSGRALEEAIRLRFDNEALVDELERLNASLERRVEERTDELERLLALRRASEARVIEAHEALRESERRKDRFIAVLSHELRNPLAPIRNSLYLLDRSPPGSKVAARSLQIIHRQVEHLSRLVDDLLDVTRISRGKIELRRARVDVCEIARRACDDHRALFERLGLELRVEASCSLWIDADETRISQVIGNLLQNAAKFSRRGGAVIASVEAVRGEAEIRVSDEGVGIAPGLLERIFDPFVQAEAGLARSRGGLGLGLALAKSLVELHRGRIRAASRGEGQGSEFVVSLPLAAPPPRSSAGPAQRGPARGMDILVIEDNVDEAESIAGVLEVEGHHVYVATDGESGMAKAHELHPEVILCDIGLPDVDGYQIARALRFGEHVPARLIALSGYARPEDRRMAMEAGFDAHLAKPPPLSELLNLVERGAAD